MKRMLTIALVLTGVALLAGCPKKHNTKDYPQAGSQVGTDSSTAANADGAQTSTSPFGSDAANGARGIPGEGTGALARKVIYFDFDKSEIKPEFADILSTAAKNLTANPGMKLKLEGNTDNRGTREYNIGLGERRAQAVRRALMLQGVTEAQVSTVSFGAERPAADGDDEAAWSQNRRVEVVYLP
jgi:peptidoglycan-associated lipoprotein